MLNHRVAAPYCSKALVFLPLSLSFILEAQKIIYRSTGSCQRWNCLSFPPSLCFRRVAMLWKDRILFYFIAIRGKVKRVRPINTKMPRYKETTCLNAQPWLLCSVSNNQHVGGGHIYMFATVQKAEVRKDTLYAKGPFHFLWHSIPLPLAQIMDLLYIHSSPLNWYPPVPLLVSTAVGDTKMLLSDSVQKTFGGRKTFMAVWHGPT